MNIIRIFLLLFLLIGRPAFAEYYISYTAPESYRTCYNCYKETTVHGADYKNEGFRRDTRIKNYCYEDGFSNYSPNVSVDTESYAEAKPDRVFGAREGYLALDEDSDFLLTNDRATADDLGSELQLTG